MQCQSPRTQQCTGQQCNPPCTAFACGWLAGWLVGAELDPAEAAAADPATGELRHNWSNICLHYFRRDWLEAVSNTLAEMGRYHIARKKITAKDGPVAVSWRGGVAAGRGGVAAAPWAVRMFAVAVGRWLRPLGVAGTCHALVAHRLL